ncbi:proteasome assembly chaperone family protein [Methanosphaerula palustris]|nr:proteasome assembly chaperone family protein [Methanosphaerula palustris]
MSPEALYDIRIISEPISGDGATILMGFPGSGLVGSIALQYLVDQKEFKQIGTMTSKYFPPFAMMAKGLINVPVRIYQKDAIVAIVADIPIHPMICYEVANGLVDWLMPFHIKEVVALAGVVTTDDQKRVFGIATTEELLERIKDVTEFLPVGSISGIASSLMTECKIRGIPAIGLLGETVNAPDPRAAVASLEVLNHMYNLEVDIQPLLEQADEIEATMHKLAEEVQSSAEGPQKRENLPMYG